MYKQRVLFRKYGRAKWISHLDLMQTLHRGLDRAGIPLCYSEGFNPHPVMSIALPLGVGVSSECELVDLGCEKEFSPSALNPYLPEGIEALDVYPVERPAKDIAWLKVTGSAETDFSPALSELFSRDCLIISKKSKRGTADCDIRPMIAVMDIKPGKMTAMISAQNPTLNPFALRECILQLRPELDPGYISFTREEIYDREGKVFR